MCVMSQGGLAITNGVDSMGADHKRCGLFAGGRCVVRSARFEGHRHTASNGGALRNILSAMAAEATLNSCPDSRMLAASMPMPMLMLTGFNVFSVAL